MRHRKVGVKAVVLPLVLLAALPLVRELRDRRRAAAFVLAADEIRSVCAVSGYPEADFLERARTMGVAGILLRPQASQFDLDEVRALVSRGFLLVPYIGNGLELITFKELRLPAVYLVASAYESPLKDHLKALRDALGDGRSWLAFADARLAASRSWDAPGPGASGGLGSLGSASRAAFLEGAEGTVSSPVLAGEARLRDGLAGALRTVVGMDDGLVVLRLDPRKDADENLGEVRRLLRAMADDGYRLDLPPSSRGGRIPGRLERALRAGLAVVLCLLGPIFALRCGVQVLRSEREDRRYPLASPFREALLASLAATGVAVAAGLAAAVAVRREPVGDGGGLALFATLLLSAMGLYLPEAPAGHGRRPAHPGLKALAWSVAAVALAAPAGRWEGLGLRAWLTSLSLSTPGLWWVADRWREWLVGYPCLLAGLCLLHHRLEEGQGPGRRGPGDPKPWLLLSLLAPLGLVWTLAGSRMPFWTVLAQTVAGGAAGLALGVLLYGAVCGASALLRRRFPVV